MRQQDARDKFAGVWRQLRRDRPGFQEALTAVKVKAHQSLKKVHDPHLRKLVIGNQAADFLAKAAADMHIVDDSCIEHHKSELCRSERALKGIGNMLGQLPHA